MEPLDIKKIEVVYRPLVLHVEDLERLMSVLRTARNSSDEVIKIYTDYNSFDSIEDFLAYYKVMQRGYKLFKVIPKILRLQCVHPYISIILDRRIARLTYDGAMDKASVVELNTVLKACERKPRIVYHGISVWSIILLQALSGKITLSPFLNRLSNDTFNVLYGLMAWIIFVHALRYSSIQLEYYRDKETFVKRHFDTIIAWSMAMCFSIVLIIYVPILLGYEHIFEIFIQIFRKLSGITRYSI